MFLGVRQWLNAERNNKHCFAINLRSNILSRVTWATWQLVDAGLTLPFIGPFPWPSYSYSLYRFITQKPEPSLLVLNCSCRCNCSGTDSGLELDCLCSVLTLFWLFVCWTVSSKLELESESHVTTDGQSTSRPVCPGIEHPSGAYDQIFITLWQLRFCFCGAPSLTRGRVSFVYAPGPRKRSPSWVRVPLVSWPYFTVSDVRLSFSSPPTTRRVTAEVFDPASTRVHSALGWNWNCLLNS
jgi:hypothetical protein